MFYVASQLLTVHVLRHTREHLVTLPVIPVGLILYIICIPLIWNNLPDIVVSGPNLFLFKKRLSEFDLHQTSYQYIDR